jgi:hypothetical protein
MRYLELEFRSIMWALLGFLFFLSAQARPWTERGQQSLLSASINVETSKDVLLTVSI